MVALAESVIRCFYVAHYLPTNRKFAGNFYAENKEGAEKIIEKWNSAGGIIYTITSLKTVCLSKTEYLQIKNKMPKS